MAFIHKRFNTQISISGDNTFQSIIKILDILDTISTKEKYLTLKNTIEAQRTKDHFYLTKIVNELIK